LIKERRTPVSFVHLEKLLERPLFEDDKNSKKKWLLNALKEVFAHHIAHCPPYARLCRKRGQTPETVAAMDDIPYLPTSLFKNELLLSIPQEELFRQIHSSATSTGVASRVGLDRATSRRQSRCFNRVILDRLGNRRFDFLILDEASCLQRSRTVSARSSTIRSMLFCAKSAVTCLDEKVGRLQLDLKNFEKQLEKTAAEGEDLVIFAFTYILYSQVLKPLLEKDLKFSLPRARILHIGGWKKLENEKISPEKLLEDCRRLFNCKAENVIDLYGFTEQSGLIYPSCPAGRRHLPVFAEALIRDPLSLEVLEAGREGLLQILTPIQTSYPGHSVLTEDIAQITGEDDCPCGRRGKTFRILGRAARAEVRGCGDIMADKFF
jgi:hypothetical protein